MLNWALAAAVAATVIFGVQYFFKTREVRRQQAEVVGYQNRQVVLNNLIGECMEYSKRNAAINPILEANNLKPKPSQATPKPSTKQ